MPAALCLPGPRHASPPPSLAQITGGGGRVARHVSPCFGSVTQASYVYVTFLLQNAGQVAVRSPKFRKSLFLCDCCSELCGAMQLNCPRLDLSCALLVAQSSSTALRMSANTPPIVCDLCATVGRCWRWLRDNRAPSRDLLPRPPRNDCFDCAKLVIDHGDYGNLREPLKRSRSLTDFPW